MHPPSPRAPIAAIVVLVVASLAVPTACSRGGDDRGEVFGTAAPSTAAPTTPTTPVTHPPTSATSSTTAPTPRTPTLDPDGVGVASFGAPMADVVASLTLALGPPTEPLAASPCASGMSEAAWGSFFTWSLDGRFTGYYYKNDLSGTPVLTTSRGIGLGSTSQQVTDAYGSDATLRPDDYGSHWEIGGPAGLQIFLDGSGPSATVRQLVGGGLSPCD